MFTGLIEEIGTVESVRRNARSFQVTIRASTILSDVKFGESIATNGVCLTVSAYNNTSFTADIMPSTMEASTFGTLRKGDKVNLERALRVGDRLGGHMVSGHIDGTGVIEGFEQDENATWITIKASTHLMKYLLLKGSIAIDGVSLTVATLGDTSFKVSIIPVTKDDTTLLHKRVGSKVNLEGDVIGKYVERLLLFGNSTQETNEQTNKSIKKQSKQEENAAFDKSLDFLRENGFA